MAFLSNYSLSPFPHTVDHIVNVKQMQEIDNASGSYLKGFGNIIWLTDMSHFGLGWLSNLNEKFTNKSTLTALGVNSNLWPSDGSHTLNMQGLGLMYNVFDYIPNLPSNTFGYPHLGRPNDHFQITPFEAIYTDRWTYEHIDPINSVDPNKTNYLDSMRIFMRDEIEGENYYLQNKTIGKNHGNWLPNSYKYKAWYKADKELYIGYEVTPKTNKGDYIIENTGDITVYAGKQVIMKPGFHTQSGSTYHAFIKSPPCTSSGMSQNSNNNDKKADENYTIKLAENNAKELGGSEERKVKIYPNPNNGSFTLEVTDFYLGSEFMIYDTFGKKMHQVSIVNNKTQINQVLDGGVYFATLLIGNNKHTEKIIVR